MNEKAIITEALRKKGYVWNASARAYELAPVAPRLQVPVLERASKHGALRPHPDKKASTGRVRVRVTGYSVRPIDPCNFSTKYIVDALRFAGIIKDDSWDDIVLAPEQQKVSSEAEEGTEILIEQTP